AADESATRALGIVFRALVRNDEIAGDRQPVHVQAVAVVDIFEVAPGCPVFAAAAGAEVRLRGRVSAAGGRNDEAAAGEEIAMRAGRSADEAERERCDADPIT